MIRMLSILFLYCFTTTAYGLVAMMNGGGLVPIMRPGSNREIPAHSTARSLNQDETRCHGISGDYWVMSRDVIVDNVRLFCAQDASIMKYNEGTVNELELNVSNLSNSTGTQRPRDAPDCIGRLQNAVIDGCDGNDMLNNPHNYKFGATLQTADEWVYKMTPLSKQVNEVTCDISYKFWWDAFEIRGKNVPSALMGADGEGLRKELSGCGAMEEWKFEQTPDDCCYQWYASGRLPIGIKSCVGRAIQSAGGASNGGCKRDADSIESWPGYGDGSRHTFKQPMSGRALYKHPQS